MNEIPPTEHCVFCGISPKEIFYEDEHVLAFAPLEPVTRGHTLVIPKKHARDLLDIDEGSLKSVAVAAQKVAKKLMAEYDATGFNLLMANGKDAQQSVFHFHWHLVPRRPGDGLDMWIKQGL